MQHAHGPAAPASLPKISEWSRASATFINSSVSAGHGGSFTHSSWHFTFDIKWGYHLVFDHTDPTVSGESVNTVEAEWW